MDMEEMEGKWIFVVIIAVLAIALTFSVWGNISKSSKLKRLEQDCRIVKADLNKFKILYKDIYSTVRGSEVNAESAESELSQCKNRVAMLEDALTLQGMSNNSGEAQ